MEIILDGIGFFGPIILFISSLSKLMFLPAYLYVYLSLSVVNLLINRWLKITIQEQRPQGSRSFIGEQYERTEEFGMPSHHSQSVFFSLVFNYLARPNMFEFVMELFVCILTVLQRYKYKNHNWKQLIAGSVLGAMVAWIGASFIKSQLELDWKKGEKIDPIPAN